MNISSSRNNNNMTIIFKKKPHIMILQETRRDISNTTSYNFVN